MSKIRTETDSLGKMKIPGDVLYGIQSERARLNYPISGEKVSLDLIYSYALLKKSAAKVNTQLGKLSKKVSKEIVAVCDEIRKGKHDEQFVVDVFQAGAGTSTNMNLNEIISNRILEMRGKKKGRYNLVSPNDIVNMSQSTNDSYPTTMRIALVVLSADLLKELKILKVCFEKQASRYRETIKSARTHLQDAVPITIGQEFQAYADTIDGLMTEYSQSISQLKILGIGGSASGTGINTHLDYHEKMIEQISKETKIQFYGNANLIESMQSQRQIGNYMNSLSTIAGELTRITSDLRLLSSGPNTGLGEIELPAVQPGSSIMPGKVNPSILECVNMICFRVMGSRHSVEHCLSASQLNLNIFMPLMSHESIESTKILTQGIAIMSEKAIDGMNVNTSRCEKYALESNGIFTAINPILGYASAAKLVHERMETGEDIKTLLKKYSDLEDKEIDEILDPIKLSNLQ